MPSHELMGEKCALAAAKARGVKLGNETGNREAVAAIKAAAQARAADLEAILNECREQGMGVRKVADAFNERGIVTPRGGKWHPTSIAGLFDRVFA